MRIAALAVLLFAASAVADEAPQKPQKRNLADYLTGTWKEGGVMLNGKWHSTRDVEYKEGGEIYFHQTNRPADFTWKAEGEDRYCATVKQTGEERCLQAVQYEDGVDMLRDGQVIVRVRGKQ